MRGIEPVRDDNGVRKNVPRSQSIFACIKTVSNIPNPIHIKTTLKMPLKIKKRNFHFTTCEKSNKRTKLIMEIAASTLKIMATISKDRGKILAKKKRIFIQISTNP